MIFMTSLTSGRSKSNRNLNPPIPDFICTGNWTNHCKIAPARVAQASTTPPRTAFSGNKILLPIVQNKPPMPISTVKLEKMGLTEGNQ